MLIEDKETVSYGIKHNTINGVSTVVSRLVRGMVIPKLLGPLSFGLFASVGLFTRYLYFFDFGASAYFIKEVAKLNHEQDSDAFALLTSQTFSILMFGIFISSICLIALGLAYEGDNSQFYSTAIFLMVPIYALTKIREYYMLFLIGTGQYRYFSLLTMLANWILLVFVTLGVYLYSAIGGVVAMLVSEIILVVAVIKVVDLRPKFHLNLSVLRKIKLYLDQYFLQITEMVAVTTDQVLLLFIFGPVGYGVYILGLSFAWIFEALSEVINNAFYPKIMTASVSSKENSINVLQLSIFLYLLVCAVFIPGAVVGLNWLILQYFFEYKSGLDIFFIILFFGISRGGLALLKKGYIATNKERLFIGVSLLSIFVNCIFAVIIFVLDISLNNAVYWLSLSNLIIYCIFYLGLVSVRNAYFVHNIFLILGLFSILVTLQFSFQELLIVESRTFLIGTTILYTVPLSLVWYYRNRISQYINKFVSMSDG